MLDDDVQELDEALGCVAEGSRMIVTQKIGRSTGQYTHAAKAWAPHTAGTLEHLLPNIRMVD